MTVTVICGTDGCQNEAEAAQDYCHRCLTLWPRLSAGPIDNPLSKD